MLYWQRTRLAPRILDQLTEAVHTVAQERNYFQPA